MAEKEYTNQEKLARFEKMRGGTCVFCGGPSFAVSDVRTCDFDADPATEVGVKCRKCGGWIVMGGFG